MGFVLRGKFWVYNVGFLAPLCWECLLVVCVCVNYIENIPNGCPIQPVNNKCMERKFKSESLCSIALEGGGRGSGELGGGGGGVVCGE